MGKIPRRLQGLLWSTPVDKLDLEKHKAYIIHQILMYGDFNHLRWLFQVYPKDKVKEVFLEQPQRIYTREAFNFIKNFVLGLKDKNISAEKYVSFIS